MMSLTAYAARRGVSPKAVSKAVAAGRLDKSVVRDEHGAPKIAGRLHAPRGVPILSSPSEDVFANSHD
jgi:hypothetical protein